MRRRELLLGIVALGFFPSFRTLSKDTDIWRGIPKEYAWLPPSKLEDEVLEVHRWLNGKRHHVRMYDLRKGDLFFLEGHDTTIWQAESDPYPTVPTASGGPVPLEALVKGHYTWGIKAIDTDVQIDRN